MLADEPQVRLFARRDLADPCYLRRVGRVIDVDVAGVALELAQFSVEPVGTAADGIECGDDTLQALNFELNIEEQNLEGSHTFIYLGIGLQHVLKVGDVLPALVALVVVDALHLKACDLGVGPRVAGDGVIQALGFSVNQVAQLAGSTSLLPVTLRQLAERRECCQALAVVLGPGQAPFQDIDRGHVERPVGGCSQASGEFPCGVTGGGRRRYGRCQRHAFQVQGRGHLPGLVRLGRLRLQAGQCRLGNLGLRPEIGQGLGVRGFIGLCRQPFGGR